MPTEQERKKDKKTKKDVDGNRVSDMVMYTREIKA